MSHDLVSIIIPCYNISPFVEQLPKVFEQTYPEIELVLVDDCSTDDSWQKLQEFKQKFAAQHRIIVARNEHNMGPGPTRCHGTALSSGKFLCFWDADDYAESTFVEKMLSSLEQEQADFAYCGHFCHSGDGESRTVEVLPELVQAQEQGLPFLQLKVKRFACEPWCKLVRREFIERNGIYFPEIFRGDDVCWTFQLVLKANKIAFVNEPLYHYKKDIANSVTKQLDERSLQSCFGMIDFQYQYVNDQGIDQTNPKILDVLMMDALNQFNLFYDLYRDNPAALQKIAQHYCDFCNIHNIPLRPFRATLRWYRLIPPFGKAKLLRDRLKREFYHYQQSARLDALVKLMAELAKNK